MLPVKTYFHKPSLLLLSIVEKLFFLFPDKVYLKLIFRINMGRKLNLSNPLSFSEKIQWLKLYDRNPLYTTLVDKRTVKDYVAKCIGEEFVIPTLGVWEKPEDIEWDSLPDKFVLKTTNGGGNVGVVICRDIKSFDKRAAIKKLKIGMRQNISGKTKEWPYKNVHKCIIAESLLEPINHPNELPDYKFFCFDGKVKGLFVATDRQTEGVDVKFDFFDENCNHLPFCQGHDNAATIPAKPSCFEQMKWAAEQLSKGIPHVRVDLYEVDNHVYFGEMTFYHLSGLVPFRPEEWDLRFGELLTLPKGTN